MDMRCTGGLRKESVAISNFDTSRIKVPEGCYDHDNENGSQISIDGIWYSLAGNGELVKADQRPYA